MTDEPKRMGRSSERESGAPLADDERRRRRAYLASLLIAALVATSLLAFGSQQDTLITAIRAAVAGFSLVIAALVWLRALPVRTVEPALVAFIFVALAAIIVRWRLDPTPVNHTLAWLPVGFVLSVLIYGKRTGLRLNLGLYGLLVAAALTLPWGSGPIPAGLLINELGVHAVTIALLHALGGRYETLLAVRDLAATHELDANTDSLTGVANRRRLGAELSSAVGHAVTTRRPLSVVSFDLDHFKQVNDRFGHDVGDSVLTEAVARVQRVTRAQDLLGRWGGEEFLLVLVDCGEAPAVDIAEACRAAIASEPVGDVGPISASFGVATLDDGEGRDDLLRRVDRRLYAAKVGGRNRVVATDADTGSAGHGRRGERAPRA